jgi:hypothetical protein
MKKNHLRTDEEDNLFLIDLLLDSNLTLSAIAKEIDLSYNDLNKRISSLGLGWIKEQKRKSSRGQSALTHVMKKLLPGQKILNEYHIGDRLKLDVYCPSYKIAAEFHGRQHFYYTQRFYESKYDFEQALKRDEKKMQKCQELGIVLVVFRYNDLLTEEAVYDRILQAIRNAKPDVKNSPEKNNIKNNQYYQQQKKKYNKRKRDMYKKMKNNNKKHYDR